MSRKIITCIALWASLFVLSCLGAPGQMVMALFLPGTLLWFAKWPGRSFAYLSFALLVLFQYMLFGLYSTAFLILCVALPVMALHYANQNAFSFNRSVAIGALAQATGFVILLFLPRVFEGQDIIYLLSKVLTDTTLSLDDFSLSIITRQLIDFGMLDKSYMPPLSPQMQVQFAQHIQAFFASGIRTALPSLLTGASLLGGLFTAVLSRRAIRRVEKTHLLETPRIKDWYLPRKTNAVLGSAFIFSMLFSMLGMTGLAPVFNISWTLILMLYIIQGISVLDFLLLRRNLHKALRVVLYALLIVFLPYALFLAGLAEQFFRIRLVTQLSDKKRMDLGFMQSEKDTEPEKEDHES